MVAIAGVGEGDTLDAASPRRVHAVSRCLRGAPPLGDLDCAGRRSPKPPGSASARRGRTPKTRRILRVPCANTHHPLLRLEASVDCSAHTLAASLKQIAALHADGLLLGETA